MRTQQQHLKEFKNLNSKKAIQATDASTKIIKENKDLLNFSIYHTFNNSFSSSVFSTPLKYADVKPTSKNNKTDKKITGLLIFCQC